MWLLLLSHIESQYTFSFEESLYVLPYLQGTYTHGGTGEDEVTRLEHEELAHVAHQLVHAKKHIYGMPTLHGVSVNIETEMDVLHVGEMLYGDEVTQDGRAVEALAEFPWQAVAAKAFLKVAGGDVNPYGDGIVVAVGKARGDVLAQLADAHHQFGLVVEPLGKIGDEEGLSALEDGRIGFHEYHGRLGQCCSSVEFPMMLGVIHAYADNFHLL